jgi:mycofactocin system glycosyltransferase
LRLALDRAVRLYAGGRVLVAHGRILRLSPAGPAALRALLAGTATPAQRRLGARLLAAGFAHPRPSPKAIDATTIIPVRDRPAELTRCLAATRGPVIVVDDGSSPPVVAPRVVRRARSGGPAAARNVGLEHVASEFVAFLDSDCVPPADWIERLGGHFDDPRVAAVAPRVEALNVRRSPLDMGPHPGEVGVTVSYVPAAALLVRRAALPEAPFDPGLRYGEDVDLIWRLLDAGHRVRYDPDVVVRHEERDVVKRRFLYGTSAAPLQRRHPKRLTHVRRPPSPLATANLARLLRAKGVPPALAPLWIAHSYVATVRALTRLVGPYGAGVVYGHIRGKIRGLPTIEGPSIP